MRATRSRNLRKTMTPQEVKLWVHLRALKREGVKFRRQVPFEYFIVDFACFSANLVIELDGGQHAAPAHREADQKRDAFLAESGFTVLRFTNHDVDDNLDGVMLVILDAVRGTPHPSGFAGHPPRKGEG